MPRDAARLRNRIDKPLGQPELSQSRGIDLEQPLAHRLKLVHRPLALGFGRLGRRVIGDVLSFFGWKHERGV